jgi:hypothetical protein
MAAYGINGGFFLVLAGSLSGGLLQSVRLEVSTLLFFFFIGSMIICWRSCRTVDVNI